MKPTQQQCLMRALVHSGFTAAKTTARYRVYSVNPALSYYVGPNGALRIGRTAGESRPVIDSLRRELIDTGRKLLEAANG